MIINNTYIPIDIEIIINDLRDLLQANDIDLLHDIKKSGSNLMITCPIHSEGKEKRPSCGISLIDKKKGNKIIEAGTVHCFTCGYTASFIEFISNCFGKNDGGAFGFKWLMKNYVSMEFNNRNPIKLNLDKKSKEQIEFQFINDEELEKYRYIHPYMYERKLNDKIIEYFDVGYDKETNCLTFPVANKEGKVIFIQRRSVNGKNFINDINALKGYTLYGLDKIYKLHEKGKLNAVYITESILDALVCWKHKKPAIAYMQGSPTQYQMKLIQEIPCRKIVLAMDNDEVGNKAIQKFKKELKNKILYRLIIPSYAKDCNDMTDEDLENSIEKLI